MQLCDIVHLWLGSILVTLVTVMPALARVKYIYSEYKISKDLGEFSHMTINQKTGNIYIGATNMLYQFDPDLNRIAEVPTGPREDNELCPERTKSYKCNLVYTMQNTYSKAVVIDYDHNKLIACISLFQGICERYDLDNIEEKEPINYQPVVANNATATTVLFIAPGPTTDDNGHQANVLYAGVSRTNTGKADTRDRVPAFASRNSEDFSLAYNDGISAKTLIKFDAQHRDSFPVYYIHGFGSEGFSYMITVQKKSPITESYITKIFRVCQNDKKFYSYAEVHLQCWHDNVLYNLSQAAFLGKAGTKLAKMLGIPVTEDVLYAVFAIGHANTAQPGRESAICIYPMRNIRHIFTKNIKACFSGVGNTGPQHIVSPTACALTPKLNVSDDYCGEHEMNNPIDGSEPIKAEAAATFSSTASAVTVAVVSDYTVAFVGTTNGHIIKIALEETQKGVVYEDVPVAEGHKINKDMYVDRDGRFLYCMTDRKLLKVNLYQCSQYTNCSTCRAANDPYCGWCSMENKCSLRTECDKYDQDLHWLSYSGRSCMSVTSVTPSKIQKEQQMIQKLSLNVSNLPPSLETYLCVFSGYGMVIPTTNLTQVQLYNGELTCNTPEPSLLPPIPTGHDHIVMDLTVRVKGNDMVSTKFTFFDCSVHRSCTSCTLSMFSCTWCIENDLCTHNPRQVCQDNKLIAPQPEKPEDFPMSDDLKVGPNHCPRIMLQDSNSSTILVPSGLKKDITLIAVNLEDSMNNIGCYFKLGSDGKDVTAKVTRLEGGTAHIQCENVLFSFVQDTDRMKVPLDIYWKRNLQSLYLDNPINIQVIMYKCTGMAKTCGECIQQPDDYKCGWCEDTCTISEHCTKGSWLPSNQVCPNVVIHKIEPLTGPVDGDTLLTITGENLGKKADDVKGGITVAGVTCNLMDDLYRPPKVIVCRTGSKANLASGDVKVVVGRVYSAIAPYRFQYVEPVLESISPLLGPQSGGTRVTITGRHLDAGTLAVVKLGTVTCNVISKNRTHLVCQSGAMRGDPSIGPQSVSAAFDKMSVTSPLQFQFIMDPVIYSVKPTRGIVSGGIKVHVNGTNLHVVQEAYMFIRREFYRRRKRRGIDYDGMGDCEIPKANNMLMSCHSPAVSNLTVPEDDLGGVKFLYGFKLDNVITYMGANDSTDRFTVYPDPIFFDFAGNREKSFQSKHESYLTINGKNLNLGFNSSDVTVKVGTGYCDVTSIDKHGAQLNCQPPKVAPSSPHNNKYPEVVVQVGRNYTRTVGYLKYEKPEVLALPVIIGLAAGGGGLVLVVIFFVVLWCIKSRENSSMRKKWQIQMDNLEVKVAKECKEAFAELQTDMTELTNDHFGQIAIPFWDYRTYCMRVLFPLDDSESHPVIRDLDVDAASREQVEYGLKLFSQLVGNKTFLLTFIRTLEATQRFSMRERVTVASLISVALQTRMEYSTEILKTLLEELIAKSVEGKNHPKLLLRRTESVAEKMLTNWFTFLLYKFLRECVGEPLFMLYQAIKWQTSKGPVDAVTSEARYSLSEDKLIRQQVDYKSITIYVQDMDQFGQQSHPVKVLDCDTISQAKEKILDAIYKNAPFSSRPPKENVDLVLLPEPLTEDPVTEPMLRDRQILSDVDFSTKHEGEYRRLNTLAHYQVKDGAYMTLMPKHQTPSIYDLTNTSEKSSKSFDYKRLGNKDDYNNILYSSRSPSLNRTASPQVVQLEMENTTNSHKGLSKIYHLVKSHEQDGAKEGDRNSKMVTEIYLTRLLATKGTLHTYVDDLFERIFSTMHRGSSLPLAIKYMFDFLDEQALLHNIQDTDVVHTWKSNSLPLRFWVNVIKNPNFIFDIYKSNIVDSCLSVVAQNFMDSCSMSEHKLGKDSPSSKLLYAKDIPTYKKWVDRYYQDIKMMPAISDQDMTVMMTEESRSHQDEFNVNAALFELYKYVKMYNADLVEALDEDEFARKSKLNQKLDQVHLAMNGKQYC